MMADNPQAPASVRARKRATVLVNGASRPFARFALKHWMRHDELVRVRQQLRYLAYAQLLARSPGATDLSLHELSVFSQNGEDGVIQEILRRMGAKHRYFIEIGASPNEANCMFLADALGWRGIFVDASADESTRLCLKYGSSERVRVLEELVTEVNVNDLLLAAGVPPDPDVLSIDVDGNDYWIWNGIRSIRPRLVIIEVNADLPAQRQLVQPNEPHRPWDGSVDYGASLGALRRLGTSKGYRLVHVDTTGTNAFFADARLEPEVPFPDETDVTERVPNHFLYGLRYAGRWRQERYLDLEAEGEHPED